MNQNDQTVSEGRGPTFYEFLAMIEGAANKYERQLGTRPDRLTVHPDWAAQIFDGITYDPWFVRANERGRPTTLYGYCLVEDVGIPRGNFLLEVSPKKPDPPTPDARRGRWLEVRPKQQIAALWWTGDEDVEGVRGVGCSRCWPRECGDYAHQEFRQNKEFRNSYHHGEYNRLHEVIDTIHPGEYLILGIKGLFKVTAEEYRELYDETGNSIAVEPDRLGLNLNHRQDAGA